MDDAVFILEALVTAEEAVVQNYLPGLDDLIFAVERERPAVYHELIFRLGRVDKIPNGLVAFADGNP